MSAFDLSIIVVSYNTRDMTLACIRSVYEQTEGASFELIVLDNASSDGSADAIDAEFADREGFTLIRSTDNLGFAGGNNAAAVHASGRRLLLLNPDTVVLDNAIDRLAAFADACPDARIWGGRTVFADGSLNPASCWGRQTLWSVTAEALGANAFFPNSKLLNPEGLGGWKRDSVRRVDIVSGCFFLIDAPLWQDLGGFDSDFFMYGEEADLCLRARKLGADPVVTPDATIVHYGGASETVRADKVIRLFRAKSLLLRRHWPRPLAAYGVAMLRLHSLVRGGLYTLASKVRRRPSFADSAAAWMRVWTTRRDWSA